MEVILAIYLIAGMCVLFAAIFRVAIKIVFFLVAAPLAIVTGFAKKENRKNLVLAIGATSLVAFSTWLWFG